MANFFSDNKDLQFHLQHPLMRKIVELKERGFAEKDLYDYAPQDFDDAMDNYRRVLEMTLFLNPIPNSYERLTDEDSPNRVCWSTTRGRSALRLPLPQSQFARMQICSPDPTCNAYLVYALVIRAALEGMANREPLPPSVGRDWKSAPVLPESLPEAIAQASGSEFIARSLPAPVVEAFLHGGEELLRLDRLDKNSLFHKQFERF